jgi:HEAT repeat protein
MGEAAASRPGVAEALKGLLSHSNSDVASRAAWALGRMGEAAASRPGVVEALAGLLSHSNSDVASRAAEALGRMGEAAASRPGVAEALVDYGRRDVALQSSQALHRLVKMCTVRIRLNHVN